MLPWGYIAHAPLTKHMNNLFKPMSCQSRVSTCLHQILLAHEITVTSVKSPHPRNPYAIISAQTRYPQIR